eukprot:TRINITY_DN8695_c0_g1_i4.p2 TRINITY_DN8695_c0_g1~~TRINITY_DN8695_c0_g1_i4.p2  ORF type:complete len:199 (+),score=27.69 TRINITY_DN8695_c0_g1_i4:665-1261(+)
MYLEDKGQLGRPRVGEGRRYFGEHSLGGAGSQGKYNVEAKPFVPLSKGRQSHSAISQTFPGYKAPTFTAPSFYSTPNLFEDQTGVNPSFFVQPSYAYYQYLDSFKDRMPQESFYSAPLPSPAIREHVPLKAMDETESKYRIQLLDILNGKDMRTTLMIKNIPNKYTQAMLLHKVDVSHNMQYNFFYLPIDPRVVFLIS